MKLGQLFMFGFEGTKLTPELARFIKETELGGVILFKRNVENLKQLEKLIRGLNDISEIPLIVGVDEEGGRVMRLPKPFAAIPPMAKLGRIENGGKYAAKIGNILGAELSACGFNINFAPVLDVNTNISNPIIGNRSFSSDASVVSRLGRILIESMQAEGVAACGKHFPGHGDTDVDSHLGLPVLSINERRFELCEFEPFKTAIDAGVASIMTAHIKANSLDPDHPATVSRKITTGILRQKLGFDGVVFTDDLTMLGMKKLMPPAESAWRAIDAGADIAMVCHDRKSQLEALDGLKRALDDGLVSEDGVASALARVAGFKGRFCSFGGKKAATDVIGCAEHRKVIKDLEDF